MTNAALTPAREAIMRLIRQGVRIRLVQPGKWTVDSKPATGAQKRALDGMKRDRQIRVEQQAVKVAGMHGFAMYWIAVPA